AGVSASVRLLLTTCPEDAADALAEALLRRRLVACVNLVRGVKSRYWWKGKLESAGECLLLLKAPAGGVSAVAAALTELHPYETPELLALPVESGLPAYLEWIEEVTAPRARAAARRRRRGS
ncbi:MAG: divalent-cation tolerance protein CutA, partial [Planctomycetota bacterium]